MGTAIGTGTINASDTPTVTLSAGTPNPVTEGNAGTTNVSFTVTISNPSATATTFTVAAVGNGSNPATAGSDFGTPSLLTVTFPANDTTPITFTVPVNGDTVPEANETFGVTLSQTAGLTVSGGSVLSQTVTIQDDDVSVSINLAASDLTAAEVGDTGFIRIERTGSTAAALPVNVTFGGTALNGTDYNLLTSPVTIPAGASFVDVPVTPIPDILAEGPETVTLTPDPEACAAANAQAHDRPWQEKHFPEAIAGHIGTATLYLTQFPACSSLYPPDLTVCARFGLQDLVEVTARLPLTTTTLAAVCRREGVPIDVLYLDIQGAELAALQGAGAYLQDTLCVQTEVEFVPLYQGQPLFGDMDAFLRSQGFAFHGGPQLRPGRVSCVF